MPTPRCRRAASSSSSVHDHSPPGAWTSMRSMAKPWLSTLRRVCGACTYEYVSFAPSNGASLSAAASYSPNFVLVAATAPPDATPRKLSVPARRGRNDSDAAVILPTVICSIVSAAPASSGVAMLARNAPLCSGASAAALCRAAAPAERAPLAAGAAWRRIRVRTPTPSPPATMMAFRHGFSRCGGGGRGGGGRGRKGGEGHGAARKGESTVSAGD